MRKRVMCVRTSLVREGSVLYEGVDGNRSIRSAKEAANFAAPFFYGSDKELLYVCVLDGKSEPVSMEMVAKGGVNKCLIDVSQVFKSAILTNGTGIICYHNHPSGSINPSKDDELVTQRLKAAGELLGISLVDHIVIGENGSYYSFREQSGGFWQEQKVEEMDYE